MNKKQSQTLSIMAFPVVLAIGIILIPVVIDYSNHMLAEQAVGQTIRWFFGHIISAIGFVLAYLTVNAIDAHVRQESLSLPGMVKPCITIGAGLYAAGLGADGIGPLAVLSAGYSPMIFFDGSGMWVTGIFVVGTIVFGIGFLSLVIYAIRSGLLKGLGRFISFFSAIVFMIAPTVLSGWALYGVAVAVFGMCIPFAGAISRETKIAG